MGLQAEFGKVDVYVDLHHQGACYVMPDDPDEFVTLSISGKFVDDPATTPGYEQYAADYDLDYSKRLNVAVYNALQGAANNRPVVRQRHALPSGSPPAGDRAGEFRAQRKRHGVVRGARDRPRRSASSIARR